MTIPVSRPLLPSFDKLRAYVAEIDANRYYTNQGALHKRLRSGLARHFAVAPEHLALGNSGTSGLIAAILATAGYATQNGRRICICPSYSFVASAIAIKACGYVPHFVDVDRDSWSFEPEHLTGVIDLASVAAIVVVAPYGRPVDFDRWHGFQEKHEIPVVVDAAAGFDTIDAPAVARGRIPACISLHATKTLSTAEGGLVIGPADIVHAADCAMNFGFDNARESVGPGINGKLSEYHAAIGLAELDAWPAKRRAFIAAACEYRKAASELGLGDQILASTMQATPYALFIARDKPEADRVARNFMARDIDYRFWYGRGIHMQREFSNCNWEPLPVTDHLGRCVIGLPFAVDLTVDEIRQVVLAISDAVRE